MQADALLTAAAGANAMQHPWGQPSATVTQRHKALWEEGCQTWVQMDGRKKSCDDLPAPARVSCVLQLCITISSPKVCSADLPALPWAAVPGCEHPGWMNAAVTFSPGHGYIPGAGDTISVCFLLLGPAELVLNLTFYLWKTLGVLG